MTDTLLDPDTLDALLVGADSGEEGRVFANAYEVMAHLTGLLRRVRAGLSARPDLSQRVLHMHPESAPCLICAAWSVPDTSPVYRSVLLSLLALDGMDEDWNYTCTENTLRRRLRQFDPDEKRLHALFGTWWFDMVAFAAEFADTPRRERIAYAIHAPRITADAAVTERWLAVHACSVEGDMTLRKRMESAVAARLLELGRGVLSPPEVRSNAAAA